MNKIFNVLLFLSFLLLVSCTRQLPQALNKIQSERYATNWNEQHQYPIPNGRSDDLHFFDKTTGFVINSNGYLSLTEDGGDSWEIVHENEGTFFRCITFRDRQNGWLGTIGTDDPFLYSRDSISLYETQDGGRNWTPVEFNGPQPKGLCGLQKVNDQFVVGCGRVRGPSYFIKTEDGGKTWYSYNMDHLAGSLIATYFFDEQRGLLIGGTTRDKKNSRSMVLETLDGGASWDTVYLSKQAGEYPWKFAFPTPEKGFISIQRNIKNGRFYHLQTEDGGKHWKEVEHTSSYYYVQGIGFINDQIGWMGGSPARTYETRDGGGTWTKMKGVGSGFNNFQFFEDGTAYGVGFGVYKNDNVFQNENGKYRAYFDDGQLRQEAQLIDAKMNGIAKTYFTNGQLSSEGMYQDNLKKGTWKYYNREGELIEKTKLKNGYKRLSNKQLQPLLGNYKTDDGTIRKIFVEDNQLYSQRGTGKKLALFAETKNRFFYAFNPSVTITFVKDKNGKTLKSITTQNGTTTEAEKID